MAGCPAAGALERYAEWPALDLYTVSLFPATCAAGLVLGLFQNKLHDNDRQLVTGPGFMLDSQQGNKLHRGHMLPSCCEVDTIFC
jgi:hypothetical protein